MAKEVGMEFAFFEFLRSFYMENKGIIRNRYREITKKYLDYNDKEKNPDAFLRKPQFEALEMYVFVKEFKGVRLILGYNMRKKGEENVVTVGTTEHAFLDENYKPLRLKKTHPEFCQALMDMVVE